MPRRADQAGVAAHDRTAERSLCRDLVGGRQARGALSHAYCAAKHALHGYYDTLRIEHLKDSIACTLLVIAGIKSHVFEHALTGDGSEHGPSEWNNDSGMTAEACAERVVEAIVNREDEVVISIKEAMQAMLLRNSDPEAFKQRMSNMLEWLAKG